MDLPPKTIFYFLQPKQSIYIFLMTKVGFPFFLDCMLMCMDALLTPSPPPPHHRACPLRNEIVPLLIYHNMYTLVTVVCEIEF